MLGGVARSTINKELASQACSIVSAIVSTSTLKWLPMLNPNNLQVHVLEPQTIHSYNAGNGREQLLND
jgi:hypothetical protein